MFGVHLFPHHLREQRVLSVLFTLLRAEQADQTRLRLGLLAGRHEIRCLAWRGNLDGRRRVEHASAVQASHSGINDRACMDHSHKLDAIAGHKLWSQARALVRDTPQTPPAFGRLRTRRFRFLN